MGNSPSKNPACFKFLLAKVSCKTQPSTVTLAQTLNNLEPIARRAGDILLSYTTGNKNIQHKGDVDLITDADKASEKYLIEELGRQFPEIGILAEEGGRRDSQNGYHWVIDPLDGTTSYAHGFPFFAVAVGLMDSNRQPVAGIVYNPFFNELFLGGDGLPARLNGQPITVSQVSSIQAALLGTGFPYTRRQHMDELMARLARVLHQVHDIRRTGSAALDICYVAAGRTDGYFETGLQPWDTCAALAILKAAGGMASKFDGSAADIFTPEIAVSNGLIHGQLIGLL